MLGGEMLDKDTMEKVLARQADRPPDIRSADQPHFFGPAPLIQLKSRRELQKILEEKCQDYKFRDPRNKEVTPLVCQRCWYNQEEFIAEKEGWLYRLWICPFCYAISSFWSCGPAG
jgi:hypothetical protein